MSAEPCPTCEGPIRETVSMVCQTCGRDYAQPTAAPSRACAWCDDPAVMRTHEGYWACQPHVKAAERLRENVIESARRLAEIEAEPVERTPEQRALARVIALCRDADHYALPRDLNSMVPAEQIRDVIDAEVPGWAELELGGTP